MGSANARVLPEPVWADPIQSRPAKMGGMHAVWTWVGCRIDMAARARTRKGSTPRLSKVAVAAAGTDELEAMMLKVSCWVLSTR